MFYEQMAKICADLKRARSTAHVKLNGSVQLRDKPSGKQVSWDEYVNRLRQRG